ncbi:MAG: ATP-binding protein [bacterium]
MKNRKIPSAPNGSGESETNSAAMQDIDFLWEAMHNAQDEAQRLSQTASEAGQLRREVNGLNGILNDKIETEKGLREQLKTLQEKIKIDRLTLAQAKLQTAELAAESAPLLKQEIQDLRLELKEKKEAMEPLIMTISRLESETASLKSSLEKAELEFGKTSALSEKNAEKTEALCRETLAKLKMEKQIGKAAINKVSMLQTELEDLKKELAISEKNMASLGRELKTSRDVLSLLKQEKLAVPLLPDEEMPYIPSGLSGEVIKPLENLLAGLRNLRPRNQQDSNQALRSCAKVVAGILGPLKAWADFSDNTFWENTPCQLHDVLAPMLDVWERAFRAKRVTLTCRIGSRHNAVAGDPGKLKTAFYQILRNAHEVLPPGSSIAVVVSTDEPRRQVCVRFSDTGPGFTAKVLKNICIPFASAGKGHLGLGLALARKIAGKFNGEMEAGNQPTGGAFVEFRFPFFEKEEAAPPES